MWVPLGSMFSFIEVLPLVLLILEAISQHRAIKAASGNEGFDYGLAYLYILGSAFWNFVGAGVFGGGTLNAPLVNYYEHGTFLTLNHAHTSLFGAFGLLALGLIYFCLRYRAGPDAEFNERPGRIAFWCYNIGLAMWIFLHFFPIGWPQLNAVYEHDRVEPAQHLAEYFVEAPTGVAIGRRQEFVVEAVAVQKTPEHRIIVVREALIFTERIGDLGQRLAEKFGEHRLVRHIVWHLAQTVHVVRKRDQLGRDIGQCVEGVAHHRRAQHFVERADMGQPRWAIAGLEQHMASRTRRSPGLIRPSRAAVSSASGTDAAEVLAC